MRAPDAVGAWLGEIMEVLCPHRQVAWHALGAVMRPVRDRVPLPVAAHVGDQLPLLVRGLSYDQWLRHRKPQRWVTRGSIGVLRRKPSMSSISLPPASTRASARGGPTTCRPIGSSSSVKPHGSDSAGQQASVIA